MITMCEAAYLAEFIRGWPRVRGTVCKLATRMLEEETKNLGNTILNDLSSGRGSISKEEGFGNDYIAMCYQTHYKKYESYERIVKHIEYWASAYVLPYVLRKLYEDKDEVVTPEQRKCMDAELMKWTTTISEGAVAYVMEYFTKGRWIADREAVRRGEKESERKNECSKRSTFRERRDALRLIDRTGFYFEEPAKDYKDLRDALFQIKGTEFVRNFLWLVINKLKKMPLADLGPGKYADEHILESVWDVVCLNWNNSGECPDGIVKSVINDELRKMSQADRLLLWYFNTYRYDSYLENYLDDSWDRWSGCGVMVTKNDDYKEAYEEISDVVAQRIFWYAGECENERVEQHKAIKKLAAELVEYHGYPREIYALIQEMKEYAKTEEDKWYESLGGTYWVVKHASEGFCYKGMYFVIYPEEAGCKTQAFFEHMMIHVFEDKLKALGATNVSCSGMID